MDRVKDMVKLPVCTKDKEAKEKETKGKPKEVSSDKANDQTNIPTNN